MICNISQSGWSWATAAIDSSVGGRRGRILFLDICPLCDARFMHGPVRPLLPLKGTRLINRVLTAESIPQNQNKSYQNKNSTLLKLSPLYNVSWFLNFSVTFTEFRQKWLSLHEGIHCTTLSVRSQPVYTSIMHVRIDRPSSLISGQNLTMIWEVQRQFRRLAHQYCRYVMYQKRKRISK